MMIYKFGTILYSAFIDISLNKTLKMFVLARPLQRERAITFFLIIL